MLVHCGIRNDTLLGVNSVTANSIRRPVVVLAERDKDDMDKQLKKALRGQKLEWHTRSGAPHAIADLEKVAAGQARTIIVLQPDVEEVNPPASTAASNHAHWPHCILLVAECLLSD